MKAAEFNTSGIRPRKNRFDAEATEQRINELSAFYKSRFAARGYDDKFPDNVNTLSKYAAKYWAGTIDKGLCLVGNTGIGKTFGMSILKELFGIRLFNAYDLTEMWQQYGIKRRGDFWSEITGAYSHCKHLEVDRLWKDIIIDDIGIEPTLNEFGTKQEVIDTILQKRYREMKDNDAYTHLTFNLVLNKTDKTAGASIEERYGARLVSRLHEMCHVIQLKGKDRRLS